MKSFQWSLVVLSMFYTASMAVPTMPPIGPDSVICPGAQHTDDCCDEIFGLERAQSTKARPAEDIHPRRIVFHCNTYLDEIYHSPLLPGIDVRHIRKRFDNEYGPWAIECPPNRYVEIDLRPDEYEIEPLLEKGWCSWYTKEERNQEKLYQVEKKKYLEAGGVACFQLQYKVASAGQSSTGQFSGIAAHSTSQGNGVKQPVAASAARMTWSIFGKGTVQQDENVAWSVISEPQPRDLYRACIQAKPGMGNLIASVGTVLLSHQK